MSDLAILIPTIGRPEKLADLVANIHAATATPHSIYLIMELDDAASQEVAEDLDAVSMVGEFGSFAVAANQGYLATAYQAAPEPFVAVGNDDVHFHSAWDTIALACMSDTIHIVGLNDGSGDCKCFQLIRRAYIEQHSGVFDQPNTLYHTYRHLCCDTEFAFYAMLRGVWANADGAVLEHRHWRYGKADPDHPNYVKGREANGADLEEYNRRRPLWDPEGKMPPCVAY